MRATARSYMLITRAALSTYLVSNDCMHFRAVLRLIFNEGTYLK